MQRFALLLLVCAMGLPQPAAGQSVPELIARGDSADARFDPSAALAAYEEALAIDSTSARALAMASKATIDLGEASTDRDTRTALFSRGEAYARRAVAIDSGNADYWFDLARALGRAALDVGVRQRVRYAVEIRECALKSLAIDPEHPGALHVLGMWNAEVKRLNGFSLFFARSFLGGGVMGKATWEEAVESLERAVALDPLRLSHHLDLGGVYATLGERDKARAEFEYVINATRRTDVNDAMYKQQATEALRKLR